MPHLSQRKRKSSDIRISGLEWPLGLIADTPISQAGRLGCRVVIFCPRADEGLAREYLSAIVRRYASTATIEVAPFDTADDGVLVLGRICEGRAGTTLVVLTIGGVVHESNMLLLSLRDLSDSGAHIILAAGDESKFSS